MSVSLTCIFSYAPRAGGIRYLTPIHIRLSNSGAHQRCWIGKSTLQKQFQLYYASKSLERERPSWRPIVHFNTIKAVRNILDELDLDLTRVTTGKSAEGSDASQEGVSAIRARLLPLIALEDTLASELSGGLAVGGGRAGVYVRAGWQSLVTATRSWPIGDTSRASQKAQVAANMAAKALFTLRRDISALWQHPAVKRLITLRHLKLEESGVL